MQKAVKFVIIIILLLLLAACSSSTSSEIEQQINIEGLNAELGSETLLIPDAVVESALLFSDPEKGQYSFSANVLKEGNYDLIPGEILLISGVGLGRITSVHEENGQIGVETGFVSLNEAFKNADIEWNQEFEFTPDVLENAVIEFYGEEFYPKSVTGGKAEWKIKSGPYEGVASIELLGENAKIFIGLTKQEGNTAVLFKAESTIGRVANYTKIEIEDHKTQNFEFRNPNLGGRVDLEITAAGGGLDQNIGLPLTMLRFPIKIGPIPAVVVVKVRTIGRLEVHGNSSVKAETGFSYGGSAGFRYNGTELTTDFNDAIANPVHEGGMGDLAGMIGLNVNAQWGFAAPEIELQMFGNTVVPFLRPEFYLRANLSWGPICQSIKAEYVIKAGLDLRFFGIGTMNVTNQEVVPYREWEAFAPDNCANKIVEGNSEKIRFKTHIPEVHNSVLLQ